MCCLFIIYQYRRRFLSIKKLPKLGAEQLEDIRQFLEFVVQSQSLTCVDKRRQLCNDLQGLLQETHPGKLTLGYIVTKVC